MSKSNYKRLGDYIREVNVRNRDLAVTRLLGLSVSKEFITSIANTIGTDMATYKVVEKGQFVYIADTSRRGDKIAIALMTEETAIVSQAYTVFEVIDREKLLPEYLMMWFRRAEFDRYARFKSHGSAREIFDWGELCDIQLPIPAIEVQREIVSEYASLSRRVALNESICDKLEQAAAALYRKTFIDNIDPQNLPHGWRMGTLGEIAETNPKLSITKGANCHFVDMDSLPTKGYNISKIEKKSFIGGAKFQNNDVLFARITPCLENGKVGIVSELLNEEIGAGSTEFIVLRGREFRLTSFLYVLSRTESFTKYAISQMKGTDGRQRVDAGSLLTYELLIPSSIELIGFENQLASLFHTITICGKENIKLSQIKELLLSKLATN